MLTQTECEGSGGHIVTLPEERDSGTLQCERCGSWLIVTGPVDGVVTINRPARADDPAEVAGELDPTPRARKRKPKADAGGA